MAANTDAERLFAEATEKMKSEAYAAGWRDALAAVGKAVSSVEPPEAGLLASGSFFVAAPAATTARASLTPGTTPALIYALLTAKPGLTPSEIIGGLAEQGHAAPENSIRTNIHRLKARQLIVNRHGKWFVK
jgi:hypothetical protein